MITRLFSAAVLGVEAVEVEVEVNTSAANEPRFNIVGLPDAAVRESIQRTLSALQNNGLRWEDGVTTVNLAPADLRKQGPSFDLPIALAMAAGGKREAITGSDEYMVTGELGLDGTLRPVKGVLAMAIEAKRKGRKKLLVPAANAREAAVIQGVTVFPVRSLNQAWNHLMGEELIDPYLLDRDAFFKASCRYEVDFEDVKGQHHVKRAIEVAVAGGHNLVMVGPPGTGKSMLAKRIPTIMPDMSEDEAIEATKIHSSAGKLDLKEGFLTTRPFRSPHHTISDAGLLGGGSNPGPGEVSLAHNGVLFLDEMPEFRRSTLEVLRQPLEDGNVSIARAAGTYNFPANFVLVGAFNPCPCGFHGDASRQCRCSPRQVESYRQRLSGPLLDRVDLHLEVPLINYRELSSKGKGESSSAIRERVTRAREIQSKRFNKIDSVSTNALMPSRYMRKYCQIDEASSNLLGRAMDRLGLSARAHDRILKVSRTLADLDGVVDIQSKHLLEAIQYRSLDRELFQKTA